MECARCGRKVDSREEIVLAHMPGKLCRGCFLDVVEKRVRKESRTRQNFAKGDSIIVLDDESVNSAAARYFLSRFTEHRSPKVRRVKVKSLGEAVGNVSAALKKYPSSKIILPIDADTEAELFLLGMVGAGHKRADPRVIKLISCLSHQEVELFSRLKGFKYSGASPGNSAIRTMLDRLEKESPDIKFGLIKSRETIDLKKRSGRNGGK